MGQFEEILDTGSEEELNNLKQWLFRENIRVETEKKEMHALQQKFILEREQFQQEMCALNQKILAERKRLKEENLFFDKKMDILKNGFENLEMDRKRLEKEKQRFIYEKESEETRKESYYSPDLKRIFFIGVKNHLTLKKRYKDLIKIFHPDNVCGDKDIIQRINKEYETLKSELEFHREA